MRMRITINQLRRIIREEVMKEAGPSEDLIAGMGAKSSGTMSGVAKAIEKIATSIDDANIEDRLNQIADYARGLPKQTRMDSSVAKEIAAALKTIHDEYPDQDFELQGHIQAMKKVFPRLPFLPK